MRTLSVNNNAPTTFNISLRLYHPSQRALLVRVLTAELALRFSGSLLIFRKWILGNGTTSRGVPRSSGEPRGLALFLLDEVVEGAPFRSSSGVLHQAFRSTGSDSPAEGSAAGERVREARFLFFFLMYSSVHRP